MTKAISPEVKEQRKQARKQQTAKSAPAKPEKKTPSPAEVVRPLMVEIKFPAITDLKQALAFDPDGNLIIGIQFKAKVDQYEIFRLVNLLKQPHETLFAIIGSPQSAMDFKFDAKLGTVEVIEAVRAIPRVSTKTTSPEAATDPLFSESQVVKIHAVAFNHMPEEEKPYGIAIDYVGKDGTGEIHTVAGRGMTPTEAIMEGVARFLPSELRDPFEVIAALEELEPSPEGYKLLRAMRVGNFDEEPEGKGESEQATKGK